MLSEHVIAYIIITEQSAIYLDPSIFFFLEENFQKEEGKKNEHSDHLIYTRYWSHNNPERYYHHPSYRAVNISSEVKEFAQSTEPASVSANIPPQDAKTCVLVPWCSGAGGLEVMLRGEQGPPSLPMAAAGYLYSHLLSAGWSKLKPFPGTHPAPAAVCESKGDKGQGYLLGESISRLSWVK